MAVEAKSRYEEDATKIRAIAELLGVGHLGIQSLKVSWSVDELLKVDLEYIPCGSKKYEEVYDNKFVENKPPDDSPSYWKQIQRLAYCNTPSVLCYEPLELAGVKGVVLSDGEILTGMILRASYVLEGQCEFRAESPKRDLLTLPSSKIVPLELYYQNLGMYLSNYWKQKSKINEVQKP